MDDLSYPVGKFSFPESVSSSDLALFIDHIAEAPARLRTAVSGLTDAQLDTPYRPGGWTVRQVVHHLADSHINSYVRFRLALTEESPTIKTYEQERWVELADNRMPVGPSLTLLESLHARWINLLRSLSAAEWKRSFRHPDLGLVSLENNAALYAWHGRHHVGHITSLRERMKW